MTTAVSRSTMKLVQESRPLVDGPWLNVGSGPASAEGWTHLDGSWQAKIAGHQWLSLAGRLLLKKEIGHWPQGVKYCDVRRGLGVAADSVAVVYSSHMVEHLHRDEALRFLTEVRRVLKPGGVVRIVVPDVEAIVGWYLAHQREPESTRKVASSDLLMDMLLLRPRQAPAGHGPIGWLTGGGEIHEHKWMYDAEGLKTLFAEAGFHDAVSRGFLDSDIPSARLSGVEIAERVSNGAGVCVEARK